MDSLGRIFSLRAEEIRGYHPLFRSIKQMRSSNLDLFRFFEKKAEENWESAGYPHRRNLQNSAPVYWYLF